MSELDRFKQTYFQECAELLEELEEQLNTAQEEGGDNEIANAIFRAVHSIKGGGGAFGFSDLVDFAHFFESVLDRVRDGDIEFSGEVVDVCLRCSDALVDLVAAARDGGEADTASVARARAELAELNGGEDGVSKPGEDFDDLDFTPVAVNLDDDDDCGEANDAGSDVGSDGGDVLGADAGGAGDEADDHAGATGGRRWRIVFKPFPSLLERGIEPLLMLRELACLGETQYVAHLDTLPSFDGYDPADVYVSWDLFVDGDVEQAKIEEVFDFAVGDCELDIGREAADGAGAHTHDITLDLAAALGSVDGADDADAAVGDSDGPDEAEPAVSSGGDAVGGDGGDGAPGLSLTAMLDAAMSEKSTDGGASGIDGAKTEADDLRPPSSGAAPAVSDAADLAPKANSAAQDAPAGGKPKSGKAGAAKPAGGKSSSKVQGNVTIRVDLDRVDRVSDMASEIVITQASLLQQVDEELKQANPELVRGLEVLTQQTRMLQDAIMAIRAQPVKSVFSRMPRLIRQLEDDLGKKIKLETQGENTEIDRTIIEQLADPLTHMIRNSADHGIESTEDRIAAGKPAEGTIVLSAEQASGRIVIKIMDDGGGIRRDRVLSRAKERGLVSPDAQLSDEEVDNLIFHPGFSTAESTSNISGRGVGMDVVRSNIERMGGQVTVRSTPGEGAVILLSLPLTLAVLDVMVVQVGDQPYVVPLSSVIESMTLSTAPLSSLPSGEDLVKFRGEYVRIADLAYLLGEPAKPDAQRFLIMCDAEGDRRLGLLVDAMLGQQQVAIKSLEANFGRVNGLAGATIMGDGQVALILDVVGIQRMLGAANAESAAA